MMIKYRWRLQLRRTRDFFDSEDADENATDSWCYCNYNKIEGLVHPWIEYIKITNVLPLMFNANKQSCPILEIDKS